MHRDPRSPLPRRLPLLAVAAVAVAIGAGQTRPDPAPETRPEAPPPLPAAEALLARHLEAVRTDGWTPGVYRFTGRLQQPSRQLSGKLTILSGGPTRLVRTVESQRLGVGRDGFRDGVAWSMTDITRPLLLEGGAAAEKRLEADLIATHGFGASITGTAPTERAIFDGRACYAVGLETVEAADATAYFDRETGLLAGVTVVQPVERHMVPFQTILADYEEHHGALIPTRRTTSMRLGPHEQLTTIVTIERVERLEPEPGRFDLPREIERLVEARERDGARPGR